MQHPHSQSVKPPDLSVVIVNWNVGQLVEQCLQSLFRLTNRVSFEVFVVDNHSHEGDWDEAMRAFPQVKFVLLNENLGFPKANNIAIKRAAGRYIALLNPDTILMNSAFDLLVDYMEAHAEQGAVGPKLLTPDGGIQFDAGRNLPSLATEFAHSFFIHHLFPKSRLGGSDYIRWWDHQTTREVGAICGACMVVRSAAIRDVGALDERFFLYWEDVEWCSRLKRAGWHITYLPAAEVHHLGGHSMAQAAASRESSYRGAVLYFRKHHGVAAALATRLLIFCGSILRIALWLVLFADPRRREEARNRLRCYCRTIAWVLTGRAESVRPPTSVEVKAPASVPLRSWTGPRHISDHGPLATGTNDLALEPAANKAHPSRERGV